MVSLSNQPLLILPPIIFSKIFSYDFIPSPYETSTSQTLQTPQTTLNLICGFHPQRLTQDFPFTPQALPLCSWHPYTPYSLRMRHTQARNSTCRTDITGHNLHQQSTARLYLHLQRPVDRSLTRHSVPERHFGRIPLQVPSRHP